MIKNIEEEREKVRKFVKHYCKISGFRLNPDVKIVELLIEGLVQNRLRKGYQYCPCRILSGKWEEDKSKICPCKWHKEEIAQDGHCKCGLFYKP